jgi:hypothetical protein
VTFGLDHREHGQDGLVRDILGKMLVAANSRVNEPPEGRQVAVAQPLHCRRVSAPESVYKFGVVQNGFSPMAADLNPPRSCNHVARAANLTRPEAVKVRFIVHKK